MVRGIRRMSAYSRAGGFAAFLLALGCETPPPRNTDHPPEMRDSTPGQESQPISSPALQTATPGKGLAVDVTIKSVSLRGDTVGITYILYNRPQSRDSLSVFAVDAPARVTKIPRPQPKTEWWVSPNYKGRDIAFWAKLGGLPPATSTIPLYFESIGLPGVVTNWIVGRFPLPEGEGDDNSTDDELRDNSVTGKTVGVEKLPPDRTPQALLARLRYLTEASCRSPLLWITDAALCGELLRDVKRAESHHSSRQAQAAKATLLHYQASLSQGTTTQSVSSSAYWLLKANSDIIYGLM